MVVESGKEPRIRSQASWVALSTIINDATNDACMYHIPFQYHYWLYHSSLNLHSNIHILVYLDPNTDLTLFTDF